jgi:hypothetical protein
MKKIALSDRGSGRDDSISDPVSNVGPEKHVE